MSTDDKCEHRNLWGSYTPYGPDTCQDCGAEVPQRGEVIDPKTGQHQNWQIRLYQAVLDGARGGEVPPEKMGYLDSFVMTTVNGVQWIGHNYRFTHQGTVRDWQTRLYRSVIDGARGGDVPPEKRGVPDVVIAREYQEKDTKPESRLSFNIDEVL